MDRGIQVKKDTYVNTYLRKDITDKEGRVVLGLVENHKEKH